jgi:membrane-associated protein
MDLLPALVDLVLHLDKHLTDLVQDYGVWTLAILFVIVFLETGVVVTPFLPGDSLLFAAGTLAGFGALDPLALFATLFFAAVLGDSLNYWFGGRIGPVAFSGRLRWLNQEHLLRTQDFYERHGGKTIVLARFIPIIRTFAPFVAGIGRMAYLRFVAYNIGGAFLWCVLLLGGGYFFGNLPAVRERFSLVIIAIIVISLLPVAVEFLRARRLSRQVEG